MWFFTKSHDVPASVVELVDTLVSEASGGNPVEVQVLSLAPSFEALPRAPVKNLPKGS